MSEHMNALTDDIRVYDAFLDLHNQASTLATDLRGQPIDNEAVIYTQEPISGTPLVVKSRRQAQGYRTTIASKLGEKSLDILSFSNHTPSHMSLATPSSVYGHRNGESYGDYKLFTEGGYVACELAGMGALSQPEALDPNERWLLGIVDLEFKTRINELRGDTKEKWDVVTKGILDSLTMVELIRDGASTVDVYEMMGREKLISAS